MLREELRLARVGAVGGLKKSELVSRIWGLMEVTFKNAEVLQELEAEGNVTSPLSMQTRWSRIEKEHGPATYSGLGPSDEENDLALRCVDAHDARAAQAWWTPHNTVWLASVRSL